MAKDTKWVTGKIHPLQIYISGEDLLEAFHAYAKWAGENPIYRNEPVKSGVNAGTIMAIPKPRPLLIESFCLFAGISKQTFYNYASKPQYHYLFDACKEIQNAVYSQNLEAGYVGEYNATLVGRKLGLVEKQEMSSPDGTMSPKINIEYNGKPISLKDDTD